MGHFGAPASNVVVSPP